MKEPYSAANDQKRIFHFHSFILNERFFMMQSRYVIRLAVAFAAVICCFSDSAKAAEVIGGQTNVILNFDALSDLASLDLSSVSPDVIVPGSIADSVAFPINARDADLRPTTFSYDSSDFLGTFAGTIEHTGSVFFNDDSVEVGNFSIAFNNDRVGGLPGGEGTGFFVESTTGLPAILFDVVNIDLENLVASESQLNIPAELAVSSEFGQFLFDNNLSQSNLEGAVVGNALVEGVVPEPSAGSLLLISLFGLASTRRR